MDGVHNFSCVCPSLFIGRRCEGISLSFVVLITFMYVWRLFSWEEALISYEKCSYEVVRTFYWGSSECFAAKLPNVMQCTATILFKDLKMQALCCLLPSIRSALMSRIERRFLLRFLRNKKVLFWVRCELFAQWSLISNEKNTRNHNVNTVEMRCTKGKESR